MTTNTSAPPKLFEHMRASASAANAAPGSAAANGIAMLHSGAVALKYGRKGKPHQALFKLTEDETALSWEDERGGLSGLAGKVTTKRCRSIRISDIAGLLIGADSKIFQRNGATDCDASLCLSLLVAPAGSAALASEEPATPRAAVTPRVLTPRMGNDADQPERASLDIRCPDDITLARWVAAIHTLVAAEGGAVADREAREAALARSAPQLHEDLTRREEALLAAKLAEAESEAERWMASKAERAMATMAEEAAMAATAGGEVVRRQKELRVRLRILFEREEVAWGIKEMKAVLVAGGMSLDGTEAKAELQRLTKALARAAKAQWDAEEAAEAARAMAAAREVAEPVEEASEAASESAEEEEAMMEEAMMEGVGAEVEADGGSEQGEEDESSGEEGEEEEEDEEGEEEDDPAMDNAMGDAMDEAMDEAAAVGDETSSGSSAAAEAAGTKNQSALMRARHASKARQNTFKAKAMAAARVGSSSTVRPGTKNMTALMRARKATAAARQTSSSQLPVAKDCSEDSS